MESVGRDCLRRGGGAVVAAVVGDVALVGSSTSIYNHNRAHCIATDIIQGMIVKRFYVLLIQ